MIMPSDYEILKAHDEEMANANQIRCARVVKYLETQGFKREIRPEFDGANVRLSGRWVNGHIVFRIHRVSDSWSFILSLVSMARRSISCPGRKAYYTLKELTELNSANTGYPFTSFTSFNEQVSQMPLEIYLETIKFLKLREKVRVLGAHDYE
jgi:hypothetical protein